MDAGKTIVSFWEGLFSGAMLVSGRVLEYLTYPLILVTDRMISCNSMLEGMTTSIFLKPSSVVSKLVEHPNNSFFKLEDYTKQAAKLLNLKTCQQYYIPSRERENI